MNQLGNYQISVKVFERIRQCELSLTDFEQLIFSGHMIESDMGAWPYPKFVFQGKLKHGVWQVACSITPKTADVAIFFPDEAPNVRVKGLVSDLLDKKRPLCPICGSIMKEGMIAYADGDEGRTAAVRDVPILECGDFQHQFMAEDAVKGIDYLVLRGLDR